MARLLLVAPTIAIILVAPWVGYIADHLHKRHLLSGGLLVYAACGIIAYLFSTLEQIILVRLVMGVSLAVVVTISTVLVGDYFAGVERETVLGRQNAGRGIVGALFPIIGGAIALFDWRFIFLVNGLALALIVPAWRLPQSTEAGRSSGTSDFRYRTALLIYSLSFFGALVLYLLTLQIGFHLTEMGIRSPVWPGIALGVASLSAAVCSLYYGRVRAWLSFASAAGIAFGLMALGYGLIAISATGTAAFVGLVFAGLGFGLNTPNCSAWLLSKVAAGARGKALGGLTTAFFLGQFASPFVYEPMVRFAGSGGTFFLIAVASLVVAAALIVSTRRSVLVTSG
jgi:MFS family permease